MAFWTKNTARATGRVLGRRGMKNRYVRAGVAATGATLRSTAKTGKILWLEVTGLFCVIFAVGIGGALWREWTHAGPENHGLKLTVSGAVLLIFAWFAGSNFWRARRLKRDG